MLTAMGVREDLLLGGISNEDFGEEFVGDCAYIHETCAVQKICTKGKPENPIPYTFVPSTYLPCLCVRHKVTSEAVSFIFIIRQTSLECKV